LRSYICTVLTKAYMCTKPIKALRLFSRLVKLNIIRLDGLKGNGED